jgi:hypothetical protein
MTTTLETNQIYLKEGAIDTSNMHLFAPDMQEAFLFLQQYENKPINPVKHQESVMTAFWWKWMPQIKTLKESNPTMPFKDLITEMLCQLPTNWDAEQVMDMISRTKQSWQKVN